MARGRKQPEVSYVGKGTRFCKLIINPLPSIDDFFFLIQFVFVSNHTTTNSQFEGKD